MRSLPAYHFDNAWLAFDGVKDGNYYHSTVSCNTDVWLQYTFASSTSLVGYSLTSREQSCCAAADTPSGWNFQGSHDGSSWTTLHQVSGAPQFGASETRRYGLVDCALGASCTYMHYRVYFPANQLRHRDGGCQAVISEIEFFGPAPAL